MTGVGDLDLRARLIALVMVCACPVYTALAGLARGVIAVVRASLVLNRRSRMAASPVRFLHADDRRPLAGAVAANGGAGATAPAVRSSSSRRWTQTRVACPSRQDCATARAFGQLAKRCAVTNRSALVKARHSMVVTAFDRPAGERASATSRCTRAEPIARPAAISFIRFVPLHGSMIYQRHRHAADTRLFDTLLLDCSLTI